MGLLKDKPAPATAADLSDEVLWSRFKQGDAQAFSRIYQLHIQALYNYGMKVADEPEVVEDAIQELFIYLWRTKENLSSTNCIKFYLFKALRRRIVASLEETVRMVQKNQAHPALQEKAEASYEQHLISGLVEEEQYRQLQASLGALTRRQREAILLRFYDNLSFQEVAEIMSLNIKSTYNLVSKAIEVLKENTRMLAGYFVFLSFLS